MNTQRSPRPSTTIACVLFLVSRVVAVTLVEESFDALSNGSLHGQGGWSASPANAATVQSGVTHGGSARACRDPVLEAFSAFGVDEGSLTSSSFVDDISIRPRLGTLLLVR